MIIEIEYFKWEDRRPKAGMEFLHENGKAACFYPNSGNVYGKMGVKYPKPTHWAYIPNLLRKDFYK